MEPQELEQTLKHLLSLEAETEIVEFKEAKNTYDFSKLGKYFSALSNEANLNRKSCAWLVFGVENKKHQVVGSHFRAKRKDLDNLKGEIANKTTHRITFIEIYEYLHRNGRVVLFQIPPAPQGLPVAFEGHYYGRDGEELVPLNLEEFERIRSQHIENDWSAGIIPDASIADLDEDAIQVARANFKEKFPKLASEVDEWDNIAFLNKAKLTIKGKITRTAIILLGKNESEYLISPAVARLRWILKDHKGEIKDYEHFCTPLLLSIDKLADKIRNLTYRYMLGDTMFPTEVSQYEPYAIREAIYNSIAHQDYTKGGEINVVEMDDQLIFTNLGNFIPGSVENVIIENAPQEHYRNRFLVTAMLNLNLVDTVGGGILKMFNYQRIRLFPLPDYELTDNRVKLILTGKILDMEYARTLSKNKDLALSDIILLDKVQKKYSITSKEEKMLKSKKLIEGRKPNYFIGANVAQKIDQKATYSKNKAFDKQYYLDFILESIKHHGSMNRKDIDELLWNKLPDWMNDKQRKNRITNSITELRKSGKIINDGTFKESVWILKED